MDLATARDALATCDWSRADHLLDQMACADPTQAAERLNLLAEARWWLGRIDECIDARTTAYSAFVQLGDDRRAGLSAVWLYEHNCFLGRPAMAGGWLRRGRRWLQAHPESAEFCSLLLRETEQLHGAGDLAAAQQHALNALELGRRLASVDLEAEALQTIGRVMIDAGDHRQGLAHLDEAMLMAIGDGVGPYTTGKVYCSVIGACEDVGDHRRAAEWTDAASRWAEHHPMAVFPGLCRVHRAELLRRRGDWKQAEREARQACEELASVKIGSAAAAWVEVGEIRRRIGDLDGAEEAFAHADALCCSPTAGLALLRLAQGRPAAAATIIDDALAASVHSPVARARLLPAKVEVDVAGDRLDDAAAAVDELELLAAKYGSEAFGAAANLSRGRLQLAAGDPSAITTLRRAVERWQELEVPYETATTQLLLAEALQAAGEVDAGEATLAAAITTFDKLGAAYDARHARRVRAQRPGGLTEREAEVLRLVARGCTNNDIARQLDLSGKTVARHLSNIFVKTGATSRSAATAFAFEHGIVSTGNR